MQSKTITIEPPYPHNPDNKHLESYYEEAVLPHYGLIGACVWESHVQTHPDNYIHIFAHKSARYVLAYDDYPSGFSVGGDNSVQALRLADGAEVLTTQTSGESFEMNVLGSFMLFRIVDDTAFDSLVNYLKIEYKKLQQKWSGQGGLVVIARDILQLAETASANQDTSALYALQNIVDSFEMHDIQDNTVDIGLLRKYIDTLLDAEFGYEMYDKGTKERTAKQVYKELSRDAEYHITATKYEARQLENMVTLVSALYGKEENGITSGITAVVLFDGDTIEYPLKHFINDELKHYFADNAYVSSANVKYHMPEKLGDYKLVEGSVEVQRIFRRELGYINF